MLLGVPGKRKYLGKKVKAFGVDHTMDIRQWVLLSDGKEVEGIRKWSLSSNSSIDLEPWDRYGGRRYKHGSFCMAAVRTKKWQENCEEQGWTQTVRQCWKAVLIYKNALEIPSLEMDPRIFRREADKSPMRTQAMLFNHNISFEMGLVGVFWCLLWRFLFGLLFVFFFFPSPPLSFLVVTTRIPGLLF